MMSSIDRLIPFTEAIGLAGMKKTRAYEEVKAGRLVVIKNGRNTFIKASEIQRFIDHLEQVTPPRALRAVT